MKLRNKKTGEIIELLAKPSFVKRENDFLQGKVNTFNSLAELNEVWEDYEEPKPQVVYYIDRDGRIVPYKNIEYPKRIFNAEQNKAIGNYFETKEEAEKAVEKLKAWKRLKDKGFRFNRWTIPEEPKTPHIKLVIEAEVDVPDSPYDLDLLFGGEE